VLPLVYPHRWRLAGFALLIAILLLALLPGLWFWPLGPKSALKLSDKLLHAITFAILALWFSGQYARGGYWKFATGLLLYGALIEACQYFVPYRRAEAGDMLADVAGIVCGLILAFAGAGGWSIRFEKWLQEKIG
jgi:VanZ family protein